MTHKHLPLVTPTGDEMKATACLIRVSRGDYRAQLKDRGHTTEPVRERAA